MVVVYLKHVADTPRERLKIKTSISCLAHALKTWTPSGPGTLHGLAILKNVLDQGKDMTSAQELQFMGSFPAGKACIKSSTGVQLIW